MIVSAFPACGKTYLVTHSTENCLDSDSSKYHYEQGTGTPEKPNWVNTCCDHTIEFSELAS